jgi:prephenate dehydrogenase
MLENIEELKNNIKIGIIGGGDMGCLYAKTFVNNNWKK